MNLKSKTKKYIFKIISIPLHNRYLILTGQFNLVMDIFNKEKKKEALQELEKAQKECKRYVNSTGSAVESLYRIRKMAINKIEVAEEKLKRLEDFGIENLKYIADAKASIRLFMEAINEEKQSYKSMNTSNAKHVGAAAAGATAGAATATFGSSIAMAMATTFGTAATGTAISSLAGAAATNAALAWLGGGAIAVGGGGMAAGSAILSMLGPIGWTISGVTLGVAGFKIAKNNRKVAEEAKKATNETRAYTKRLRSAFDSITELSWEIEKNCKKLDELINNLSSALYTSIVITIIQLCSQINRRFSL